MQTKLKFIWNEFEGQKFNYGDCSPLGRSLLQRCIVWENEGDWEDWDRETEYIATMQKEYQQWSIDCVQRFRTGEKPELTLIDIKMLAWIERDKETKGILKELVKVVDGWWGLRNCDLDEESEYIERMEDQIVQDLMNYEDLLTEINPSHRYFDFDTGYLCDSLISCDT